MFPSESCNSVSNGTFCEFRPFSVIAEMFSPRTPWTTLRTPVWEPRVYTKTVELLMCIVGWQDQIKHCLKHFSNRLQLIWSSFMIVNTEIWGVSYILKRWGHLPKWQRMSTSTYAAYVFCLHQSKSVHPQWFTCFKNHRARERALLSKLSTEFWK